MCTHLKRRDNGRYYLRRRVPLDLVSVLGKTEFSKTLGTSDYAEAVALCRQEGVRLDAEWAALRASIQAKKVLADVLTTAQSDADAARRAHEDAEREREEAEDWYQGIVGHARDEGLDEDEALAFEYEVERRVRLERAVQCRLEAGVEVGQQTGQVADRPEPRPSYAVKTLRDVVPSWTKRNAPKKNAISRTYKALSLFEQAVGVIPLAELKKAHGAAFVLFLLDSEARGFGNKTASNHAACITALLAVAAKDDWIERNPLDLTINKNVGAEKREPWTDTELKLMYGHALFSDRMADVPRWQGVNPVDGRALLLILQHSGARIGEIAQLRRGDFQVRDNVSSIRITDDAGTVKTAESERTIPLTEHLLADQWFGAWLASVMDGSRAADPAFPSMVGRTRGPGDTAVQWFRSFRDDAGLPAGPLEGSHKFRHWIRTAMNALDIAEATQDAITGHAVGGSTGKKVYTHVPLPVMFAALNRVPYPKVSATA